MPVPALAREVINPAAVAPIATPAAILKTFRRVVPSMSISLMISSFSMLVTFHSYGESRLIEKLVHFQDPIVKLGTFWIVPDKPAVIDSYSIVVLIPMDYLRKKNRWDDDYEKRDGRECRRETLDFDIGSGASVCVFNIQTKVVETTSISRQCIAC